ncbi:hypothetical protein SPRG_11740 [Saprolegnia parasitica CBS 223.65]|uniref:Uncharacterized protein n=1 Tax=Saprolegnia parasitica (strain CBS 223.65) TaxID=695850 RepID=A0A067BWA1_SAPPC|nr:hypothetical protein SPRG_11740 [Saprolegnia parasitica CBS 223.65]KDO22558.1 hypothetical protein SPRG_11740 [Saprolegnia parasitica CBS 223.65]|eukprot:XP_012206804.1 hypothetical protein SPRG_11740 [Saprolegnia parasitica CBS 223.65]
MEPITVPFTPVAEESLWEASSRRLAAASAARRALLEEKRARAGSILERAKSIAADVAALQGQYATLATHDLQQRLARAEVRRLIVLDKRRLLAGRHGNYVRSVYLTTKYLAREAGDRRALAKDAATARRQMHLDAIAGRTRYLLAAQPQRSTCAHRLMDAQWLHTALASASAQEAAASVRAALIGARVDALQAAAARREHVARQRYRETDLRCRVVATTLDVRLRAASARRSAFLAARTSRITERRELLRARKWTAAHNARRFVAWALKDKLAQATKRREAVLERRRAACAARNWYARVVSHRHAEVVAERIACLTARSSDKHAAAAHRRRDQQRNIFCQLVGLRHERVAHVLATQTQHLARTAGRKMTLAALRVAELQHAQAQATHARWLHTQRVRERRDHLALFRAQCLRSRTFARHRSAEIRRALQLAAICAGVDEAAAKRDAARLRVQFATESLRAHLEFRLLRADEKRHLYSANKTAAAVFFAAQGEIVRRRLASRDEARRLTYAYEMESAGLRQSIARTQRARSHLLARALVAGRQKYLAEARAERGLLAALRHANAADRRDEVREAKQETARRTTQRVSLARLERQSTDIVDVAVKTAMAATIALHAERRRVALLQARTDGARAQSHRARDVARVQKVARRIEALTLREQSQQRVDESAKRREMLLAQRKLGLSASLQPGLLVVGTAIPLPNSA